MKIRFLLLLLLLLTACTPAANQDTGFESPSAQPPTEESAIETEAPVTEPAETEIPAPTEPPATELPLTQEPICAKLLNPEDGVELPAVGKVTFAWEPVEGAGSYLLNFTLPNGTLVTFETDETTKDRYMEAFGMSGEFEWNVAALDKIGNEICASISFNFTRPAISTGVEGGGGGSSGNGGSCPYGICPPDQQ